MVIDTLENLDKYVSLNPLFKDVLDFIKSNDLNSLEIGKHEIKGSDLFVNVQVAKGKTKEVAVLETHKKMIDIQIPLSAEETYGYTPLCDLPDAEYNNEKDITKYEGMADTYVTCKPGEFAIFFPQDGHAPCIAGVPEIKKAIFKVLA
ncbi:YhcH/YjgK/YiaL family protein [Marseilla massiliensis]|uniref:YhcH/YjgK/YiaL family protein n=1 Tax=Marseilla massiliensis TaxID=1841864 RepID=A0A938WTW2_9BACT|nr:YhcH/YjgK/YiaL family protein [Marseilla massiliensis]MBM6674054.1 YhcH/YjgK/YiaL family protein [Marseilla massiliensis]